MDNTTLTVRAKFLTAPKSPGVPGILMLNQSKFSWKANDPKAAQNLDVPFRTIQGHRANKETPKFQKALLNMFKDAEMKEGYLFEFDNFKDRDECRNLVAKVLGKIQSEGGAKNAGEGQSRPSGTELQISNEQHKKEADRRMKLLTEDIELQKLHKQLVINGVLSDADFWAARKRTLDENASTTSKQRTGLKSAMLADVRPMHDGRTNKVTFNLTPEIIHQIFAEKPAVHRAFLVYVPSKMTEVEFWTKYCKADLIHRTQNAASVAAEAEEDEHLAMFLKDDDIVASEARKKIRKVDPTVDMTADVADDYLSLPGHGIFRDGSKETVMEDATQVKRTLLHDINRHASVVLDGRILDVEGLRDTTTVANALLNAREGEAAPKDDESSVEKRRLDRVHEMTKVDDLEGPQAHPYVPLCIQDPRSYFDSQRPNTEATGSTNTGLIGKSATKPLNRQEILSAFARQRSELQASSFTGMVVSPEAATRVLHELTHYISNRNFQVGKHAGNFLDNLPHNTKEELLQLSATSHELLRHFWAAFPLSSNSLREKASRIKGALTQIQMKLQGLLKEAEKQDYRHHISQLAQSLTQALDAAILHYENEEKRTVKISQKASALNGVPISV
eukprot:c5163_g1_i1 orf=729-2585(-)